MNTERNEQGLGKAQRKALDFIRQINGWHSYAADVRGVVLSLASRGLVEVSESSKQFRAIFPMHCDSCEAAMINGVFCHENGCPNSRKRYVNGEWVKVRECFECGSEVYGDAVCCSDDDTTEDSDAKPCGCADGEECEDCGANRYTGKPCVNFEKEETEEEYSNE